MPEEVLNRKKNLNILKFIIPALVPIFYMQGYAYYTGTLAPYNLNELFYPISPEQALVHAFFFYTGIFSYFNYILIFSASLFLFLFTITFLVEKINYRVTSRFEKIILDFIINHKKSLLPPIYIIIISYFLVLLFLIILVPYYVGNKSEIEDIKNEKYRRKEYYIDLNTQEEKINAFIIQSSPNLITFIDENKKVITIPMSEIHSITSNLKEK